VRNIFRKVAERYNYDYDFKYDWTILNKQKEKKEETNEDNNIDVTNTDKLVTTPSTQIVLSGIIDKKLNL
jgi:hypothetical protein